MKHHNITHVIFDMDGLLLNTEDLYTIAFQNIFTPYGKEFDWNTKLEIMGKRLEFGADFMIKKFDLPLTVEEFKIKVDSQLEKLFSQSKLMPGAKKLVEHLKKHNIPIALCTGSSYEAFLIKTVHHDEVFCNFETKVFCGSDKEVKFGKPHPDAYEITRKRFKSNIPLAENCLVFEDSPNGVLSAIAAKMKCVMVPHPRLKKDQCPNATLIINSLLDFRPEDFGLPSYP